MDTQPTPSATVAMNLIGLLDSVEHSGPQWSYESTDLDLTVLTWRGPQQIAAHINTEVDVLLIGLVGAGEILVNGVVDRLTPNVAILIPKGAERSLRCVDAPWSYLSVHRRRRGLWPTVRGNTSSAD